MYKNILGVLMLIMPLFSYGQQGDTLSIIGVGDIMMGSNFPDNSYLPPSDGKNLFDDVEAVLKNADITFGNLEGVILDEGGTAKKCNDPKTCYIFRTPERYLENLVAAGFDVLSTANNHVSDFGLTGRKGTASSLEKYKIPFAGFDTKPYVIFTKNNIKYGFAAFAPNSGTSSMANISKAMEIVSMLNDSCDIVLVSVHGGAEGKNYQHVTKKDEVFLGHNRGNIYSFAHKMVDSGADIVFGHGPHVTRAVEKYKDKFIAYSLGNFCTYRRFNLSGPNGYAPIIKVFISREGNFHYAEVVSIKQTPPGGPKIDSSHTAFKYIKQLTIEDFSENKLIFTDQGIIK